MTDQNNQNPTQDPSGGSSTTPVGDNNTGDFPTSAVDSNMPPFPLPDTPNQQSSQAPVGTENVELPPSPILTSADEEKGQGAVTSDLGIPPVVVKSPGGKGIKNKKRFVATILGVLLLVGGIGAGVILVQRQQDLREKAAVCPEANLPKIDDACTNQFPPLSPNRTFSGNCRVYYCPDGCGGDGICVDAVAAQQNPTLTADTNAWSKMVVCGDAILGPNECGQVDFLAQDGLYCGATGCAAKQLQCNPTRAGCESTPTQQPQPDITLSGTTYCTVKGTSTRQNISGIPIRLISGGTQVIATSGSNGIWMATKPLDQWIGAIRPNGGSTYPDASATDAFTGRDNGITCTDSNIEGTSFQANPDGGATLIETLGCKRTIPANYASFNLGYCPTTETPAPTPSPTDTPITPTATPVGTCPQPSLTCQSYDFGTQWKLTLPANTPTLRTVSVRAWGPGASGPDLFNYPSVPISQIPSNLLNDWLPYDSEDFGQTFYGEAEITCGSVKSNKVSANCTVPAQPVGVSGQCLDIRAYKVEGDVGVRDNWVILTAEELSKLAVGDQVHFTVRGSFSIPNSLDRARFSITSSANATSVWRTPVTTVKPSVEMAVRIDTKEFYDVYTIPEGQTSFYVNAQIHDVNNDRWF